MNNNEQYFARCKKCFPNRAQRNPINHNTMAHLYNRTMDDRKRVEQSKEVRTFIEIWECEWAKMKSENPEIASFVKKNCLAKEPLKPRDAFFGKCIQCMFYAIILKSDKDRNNASYNF